MTRNRIVSLGACALAIGVLSLSIPQLDAQSGAGIQQAVDSAYAKFRTLQEGKNADYIPALAKVDPNLFGIAVVTADGKVYTAGDVKTEVSIQSISKVFTMAQVIQEQGLESIEKRIGVDATGARFNSIIAVEGVRTVVGSGAPEMNPLVNPGAISATSMVRGATSDEVWKKIIGFHNDAAGRQLSVLQDVYKSESDTNQRNQAIGALMLAYGYIKDNWQQAVDLYTRQCSIGVNAKDLATMAATLAFGGTNPVTNKQVLDAAKVPGVLAVMATAGLYDDSGKWLYHTGLPAKSGVGGGIIAVSPGKFGIAVVSPPLDDAGNSVRAQRAIAAISNQLGGNPYWWPSDRPRGPGAICSGHRCGLVSDEGGCLQADDDQTRRQHEGDCGDRPGIVSDGDAACPGTNRRRDPRQRRSDHWRDRATRAGETRVQDRRRRHALSGMGQALEPRGDACGRSAHDRWPPIPGQSRTGGRPIDRRRDLRRRRIASDVGGDIDHPDRSGLLAAARWVDRRGVQLYPVQRCGAAQSELGHRVPPARVPDTAHRVAHPDEERRRFGSRRSGDPWRCRICDTPGRVGSS